MNINEIFKSQVDQGATEQFLYAVDLERKGSPRQVVASMRWHKGSLDSFPADLEFVRMLAESTPLFKEVT
jgi:hypothetical protein